VDFVVHALKRGGSYPVESKSLRCFHEYEWLNWRHRCSFRTSGNTTVTHKSSSVELITNGSSDDRP